MTKHPRRLLLSLIALGAMAFGATTIAQAASGSADRGATTANTARHAAQRVVHGRRATRRAEPSGENPENGTETDTENGPSDGPGGHADPPGNVDHQFSGQE